MVWSKWHKALMAAVVCLGLAKAESAWSQTVPSASSAPAVQAERVMTVVENGKPNCCRVLQTWRQANGTQAFHLQSLDTGEILTIEEMGLSVAQEGGRKNVPMRIFHWGASRSSPPAAPLPPTRHSQSGQSGLVHRLFGHPDSRQGKTPTVPEGGQVACVPSASGGQASAPGAAKTSLTQCSASNPSENASPMEMAPPRTSSPQPRGLAVALRDYFHPRNRRPATRSGTQVRNLGPSASPPATQALAISQPPSPGPVTQPVAQASAVMSNSTPSTGKSQVAQPCHSQVVQPSSHSQVAQPCHSQVVQPSSHSQVAQPSGRVAPVPCNSQVAQAANNCHEPFSTAITASGTPKVIDKNPIKTVAATKPQTVASSRNEVPEVLPLTVQPEAARRGPLQNLWRRAFPSQASGHAGVPVAAGATRQRRDILTSPERLQAQPMASGRQGLPPGAQSVVAANQFPHTSGHQGLPPGAQSVVAANNGLSQGITYVPVPMVTVPQPSRPPTPPEPRLPPLPPGPVLPNAFYPQPNPSAPGANQPMQPCFYHPQPGQGQACQTGCCPSAGCNVGFCSSHFCQPGGCPSCPPYVAQVCQAQCQSCYGNLPTYPNPAMDRPGMLASYGSILAQVISVLRESPFPAQREWAASTLATYDWRTQPHVLSALLNAAQHDPAGSVRASCAFSLGKMNANVEQVRTALQALSTDSDPRVRQEAAQSLRRFGVEVSRK